MTTQRYLNEAVAVDFEIERRKPVTVNRCSFTWWESRHFGLSYALRLNNCQQSMCQSSRRHQYIHFGMWQERFSVLALIWFDKTSSLPWLKCESTRPLLWLQSVAYVQACLHVGISNFSFNSGISSSCLPACGIIWYLTNFAFSLQKRMPCTPSRWRPWRCTRKMPLMNHVWWGTLFDQSHTISSTFWWIANAKEYIFWRITHGRSHFLMYHTRKKTHCVRNLMVIFHCLQSWNWWFFVLELLICIFLSDGVILAFCKRRGREERGCSAV